MLMTSRNSAEQLTWLCPCPLPQLAGTCFQDYFRPSSWTLPLKTKTKHCQPCCLFFPFFLFTLSHSVVSNSFQPYSLPVSSVHEIDQAKILEWIAISAPGVLPHPGIKAASPAWQFSFSHEGINEWLHTQVVSLIKVTESVFQPWCPHHWASDLS